MRKCLYMSDYLDFHVLKKERKNEDLGRTHGGQPAMFFQAGPQRNLARQGAVSVSFLDRWGSNPVGPRSTETAQTGKRKAKGRDLDFWPSWALFFEHKKQWK